MHFFKVYKQLEKKKTSVKEMFDREEAVEIVRDSIDNYIETFAK